VESSKDIKGYLDRTDKYRKHKKFKVSKDILNKANSLRRERLTELLKKAKK